MEGRAYGALAGLALGDALGMPTQSMSRDAIARQYGPITGLMAAGPAQQVARGFPAGRVTDDTAQALIVAQLLVDGAGHLDPSHLGQRLTAWEGEVAARGELDLLGPSTKAALAGLAAGLAPQELGRDGVTNGAAMRVAPVGLAHPPGPGLLTAVVETSSLTHNTHQALAAAAAVATAVSGGLEGWDLDQCLSAALGAAEQAERLGHWHAGGAFTARWRTFDQLAHGLDQARFLNLLTNVVGSSVLAAESVVAALLLVRHFADRPYHGLLAAAAMGGDTDTVAAMAGAIWGALHGPDVYPASMLEQVERVNALELEQLATRLVGVRQILRGVEE